MSNYRNSNKCRIYVGNLPTNIRSKELDDLFYKFGKIVSIDLKDHRDPPFAFIEFNDPRDAEDAIYERDRYNYDGYKLRVEFPRNPGGAFRGHGAGRGRGRDRGGPKRSQYRCLVSGLPVTGSWQDLKDHMYDAGDICFADVYKDGTGVIEFSRYDDMKYAIKKFDDSKFRSHRGDETRIRVKEDYGKPLSVSPRNSKYKRHSKSRTPLSKSRSKSSSSRSRSRSLISKSRSRSPTSKSRSRSPPSKSRLRSPTSKSRSRSPISRSRSRSPISKSRSRSPISRSRSRSPISKSRSNSPIVKSGSKSPDEDRKSRKRSRLESPLSKKRQKKSSS